MDPDYLRERLERVIAATPATNITSGYWVGDKAGERQVSDNFRSGRIYWQAARRSALHGIEAMDQGNPEMAEMLLRNAEGLRAAAVEAQVTQGQFEALLHDAKPRGKANKNARDLRLAVAVTEQERQGLKGKAARDVAIKSDPALKAEFATKGDRAIRDALRRGRGEKLEG